MIANRRRVAAALAATPFFALAVRAQTYPDHPVRFVVPNPPGGPTDVVGRVLSDQMRAPLGQPIVVDNRPGAAGMIATGIVASAAPDGYTVLVTSRSNHVIAPLVQKSATDPQRDLAPAGVALRAAGVLVTHRNEPFNTLPGLIAYAKANPGRLLFGSSGVGASNHVDLELFRSKTGTEIGHVPYKGGSPMLTGVMGGEVDLAICDLSSTQAGMRNGSLVPLAQTGTRRLASLAQVPTLAECGMPDYDPAFWVGLAVPRHTPAAVVERLNRALNAALSDTRTLAMAQVNGWTVVGGAPSVLSDLVRSDTAVYAALIPKLGLQAN